jgi:hygromycin-B 7''-O-kinase
VSALLPPVDSWSDWSSIFKDVGIWRPAIDAICEQEGIGYRRIEIPRSNTNAVFILDRSLVLKVYNPVWPEFDMERRLLEVLGGNGAVPTPSIVASGKLLDRLSWRYLIQEYCPGLTLEAIRPEITRDDLLGIASGVGAVVRALHRTDIRLFDGIDAGEPWGTFVGRRRREVLPELVGKGVIASEVADALADTLDEAIAGNSQTPHVIVHGDLESDHVLLERSGGEWAVASLIDFGDAKVGLRDYEWMPLWFGLFDRDIRMMRAFLEAYDPDLLTDDELPRRMMAWTLLHDFGTDAVVELLGKTNAAIPVSSIDVLQELLWPGIATMRTSRPSRLIC